MHLRRYSTMNSETTIAALYHFTKNPLGDLAKVQSELLQLGRDHAIKGTLLLAAEGINGTIAGSQDDIHLLIEAIETHLKIEKLSWKQSHATKNPFYRWKVKIKKEIVTLGQNSKQVASKTGRYVAAKDWNALINDPDVVLVDTRNDYETAIGKFPGAIDPKTKNFRDFPTFVSNHLVNSKDKKIAMYCTGGIRCEKASNYLIERGFENVYQLKGGVLQYFEDHDSDENLWQGECFVFDNRVSVNKKLEKGQYDQCYGCRSAITEEDKKHRHYEPGVSCHHCYDSTSQTQKKRFQERQYQQTIAKKRGQSHIGTRQINETA